MGSRASTGSCKLSFLAFIGPMGSRAETCWLFLGAKIPAKCLLGGSWVVLSGVRSPLMWVITKVTLLITPLITYNYP